MAVHPYDLIADPQKTTITESGGISLGYGAGPGLANAIFWNRIGSLFSCYRPAVARLSVFSMDDLHQPLPLRRGKQDWRPNHTQAQYSGPGLRIAEDRNASVSGLHCRFKLRNTTKRQRSYVLCFHGSVEQWAFFDYQRTDGKGTTFPAPLVKCSIDPRQREVTITQPHPHHGLPQPVNSIQRVWLELPGVRNARLMSYGFGQNEGDLRALWQDHGALASLRIRLGQVGGRFDADPKGYRSAGVSPASSGNGGRDASPTTGKSVIFSHQHPLYYFTCVVELEPGVEREVIVRSDFHTDDEAGDLRSAAERKRRYPKPDTALKKCEREWRKYLTEGVPQLDCDDKPLVRYWYYVWYVLRANRTAPGRHITHPFTAPSKYMYWGPWIWDGYFHVLGEMWLKDPNIAQNSIRAVLDMQFPNGFIPVCSGSNYRMCFHEDVPGYLNPQGGGFASYVEPELGGYKELNHPFEAEIRTSTGKFIHNEKTQTPLIGPAVFEYCQLHYDLEFAAEALPGLARFDEWIAKRRLDSQGRFTLWHGDESGWDNATRHYPVPARPFDVQVHLLMHRIAIEVVSTWLSVDPAAQASESASRMQAGFDVLKSYWCKRDKWHYDFSGSGNKRRRQIAASGLFAMMFRQKNAVLEACKNALGHEKVFNTPYPIPTLARCDPDYAPHGWGWNGPAWLQVNYFVICGLLKNSCYSEAFDLWDKTRAMIMRDGKPHSFELYDPESGTGMGCPDYSWQAMVNHLLIRYFAGVGEHFIEPNLPPGMNNLKLSNLPGCVRSIAWSRKGRKLNLKLTYSDSCPRETWRPLISTKAMGKIKQVSASCGNFITINKAVYRPPIDAPIQRDWEIIIECQ